MRTSSDELFRLIKSLTKSEKGYFIKYTSKHIVGGENDYLILYRIIDKQKTYDEEKIKAKINSKAMLKRFAFLKHYLFKIISESLYAFHLKSSVVAEAMNRYTISELLFKKGLHESAFKETVKIKAYAAENENYNLMLQCLNLQRTLLPFLDKKTIRKNNTSMESIRNDENKTLLQQSVYYKIFHMSSALFDFLRTKGAPSTKSQIHEFKSYLQAVNNDYVFDEKIMTQKSKQHYYHTMGFYHQMMGDDVMCFNYRKKQIALMDTMSRKVLEAMPLTYAGAIGNLIIASKILKKYNEVEYYINHVNKFCSLLKGPQKENIEWKIFSNTAVVKLNTYIQTARFGDFKTYLAECEKKLIAYKSKNDFSNELLVYYFAAYYYFLHNDYKKCMKYITLINSEENYKKLRPEIFTLIKFFEICIHHKLNNHELAESILRSAVYQINKYKYVFRLELLLILFLKNELKEKNKNTFSVHGLNKLRIEVDELFKIKGEKDADEYFDVYAWIQAELSGHSQAEIITVQVGAIKK